MKWYYAQNSERQGPVDKEQLHALLVQGVINLDALVWQEGMADWQPYRSITALGTVVGDGMVECSECGSILPKEETIKFENFNICVNCKPSFFQKLKEGVDLAPAEVSRTGKLIIADLQATFPDRCVKCNKPVTGLKRKMKFAYYTPWLYLLLLVNLIVFIIVAAIVSKKATYEIAVCDYHKRKRTQTILIAWGLILFSIVLFIVAGAISSFWPVMVGVLFIVGGVIFGAIRAPYLTPSFIDKEIARIKGAGPEFLNSLPEKR
ncbi:MAG: DUF4339 domain-containing protein [Verrucomicrobiota bacterium]|nr:DUF4339 domain-containing protein [Verrucomicrobiota bacterium]